MSQNNNNSWPQILLTSRDINAKKIYDTNWSNSSLGPIENWSQSFITIITTSMGSQFPALILWGKNFITFFNAGYASVLGDKQNWALGKPLKDVWPEAWESLYGMLKEVIATGNGSWAEDRIYFLNRNGFPEESYFTFSFARIIDEKGGFGGILCTAIETTKKVISERRFGILREIANQASAKTNPTSVCIESIEVLKKIKSDIPLAMISMLSPDNLKTELIGFFGMENPESFISLNPDNTNNPFLKVFKTGIPFYVDDLKTYNFYPQPLTAETPVKNGLLLPIKISTSSPVIGFLLVGLSVQLPYDNAYKSFLDLLASQISAAVAGAKLQEEARNSVKVLAELDVMKTKFFSNVSHEFRTPLTLLLGPLEHAMENSTGTEITFDKETLNTIYRNALRLLKLVNSLLDFSRMEAGRVKAHFEPIDIGGLTKELVSQFRSLIENASLTLEMNIDNILSPVFIDKEMWEKIVLNLVSNAYKFTFTGGIKVTVKNYPDKVVLLVNDTGIGISQKEVPKLFERFYRVEDARSRSFEGSGIGLALVQDMVKIHSGEIKVESTEGIGTTIIVSIPKTPGHNNINTTPKITNTSSRIKAPVFIEEAKRWNEVKSDSFLQNGNKPILLIVDDNADMREYLFKLLKYDYNLLTANNGKTALRLMLTQKPDLIISDIMMPEMNGMELLKELKSHEKTIGIPVIFLSAQAGSEATIEGLAAGADDYLVKPFSAKELLARVQTQLNMVKLRTSLDMERRSLAARDEFLAIASHEINTPLAPLKTQLENLTRALDSNKLATFSPERLKIIIKIFHTQVNKISHLIRDLLDVSRISNGLMILNKQNSDLNEIITRVVEDYSEQIKIAKCTVKLNLGNNVTGFWDDNRIEQVVTNLLTNALKYAGGKPIKILTTINNDKAFLVVADNGPGILKENFSKIFERYERINTSSNNGGIGLGLYISRQIVESHGGLINIDSEPESGSRFIVELPVEMRKPHYVN